jgi:uncharacterized protein (DUF362 family)
MVKKNIFLTIYTGVKSQFSMPKKVKKNDLQIIPRINRPEIFLMIIRVLSV